jgi:ribonuclease P protein component
LRRRVEFLRAQRSGRRVQTAHFVVYLVAHSGSDPARLGITVARRVGNAVARNQIKRRVRETFRTMLRLALPAGTDVVVIARVGAAGLPTPTIHEELLGVIRTISVRKAPPAV